MTEYIERWALNSSCQEIYEETVREHKDMTAEEVEKLLLRFEKAIKQAPAADVMEVRHGKWEVYLGGKELMCSSCKATFWDEEQAGGSNYCPNCGADMRGDKNA